jgi:lambda family phage portal protein
MNLKFWKPNKQKSKKRGFEAASKSKRLKGWFASGRSANSETSIGLPMLRNRSRDLRRNNAHAAKAIQVITSNVVGPGIKTQFTDPGFDGTQDGPVEAAWKQWANSKNIDYDGKHNLEAMQGLVMDAVVESGEVLIRKRFNSALRYPLQYQVLESDFLAISKTGLAPERGNTIIQGIEFDEQGRRVAYWLYDRHPGGQDKFGLFQQVEAQRVPVDEVLHVYRQERPGQARGVPWGAPCMVRLKDLDDFADATVMRQKVAACFTAFVRELNPELVERPDEDCELMERLEPALIEELPFGKTIEFPTLPTPENYADFMRVELRTVAAGFGVTYESLSGDYSNTNFSSGRMGWLEFHRNVAKWRRQIIMDQMLDPIVQDFKDMVAIMGMNTDQATFQHVPPRREMIDPTKEIPAIVDGIRAGVTTLSDEIMAQGRDPREHLVRYQQDMQKIDELGLVLDSDARKTTKNGQQQAQATEEGGTESETQN